MKKIAFYTPNGSVEATSHVCHVCKNDNYGKYSQKHNWQFICDTCQNREQATGFDRIKKTWN